MINRILITTCIIALFIILALNTIPFFWNPTPPTYIRQDTISGMAIRHMNRLFTLNFEQQKETIDILNRSISVGHLTPSNEDPKLEFEEIIIYRFDEPPIILTPLAWIDRNLYYQSLDGSPGYLMEVSKGQLYQILSESYDRKPYN